MEVAQNQPQNLHDDSDEYFNKPDILDIASPNTNFRYGWKASQQEKEKISLTALADHNYCNLSECNLILERMISEYLKNKSLKFHNFAPADDDIQEFSKNILLDINKIQFVSDGQMYDDNKNVLDFEEQVQNIVDAVTLKETNEENLQELSIGTEIEQIIDVETKPLKEEKFSLSTDQKQVLQKLGNFAENLLSKSKLLLNNETEMNEQGFERFLSTALQEMKQLTISRREQAVQTELSKKALRRLNAEQKLQNKRYSSSSCSSTDSETDGNSSSSSTSSSSSNSSVSTKIEDNKRLKKEKTGNKSDLGGDEAESDSIDENDKEIERLINFDGLLMKKQKYNGGSQLPTKGTDILKLKTKLKAIDLLLAGSCSDETESSSDSVDEPIVKAENDLPEDVTMTNVNNGQDLKKTEENEESDKEVITEKEFLKRYNDSLKNHFLNDSSSMSEDSEGSDVLQNLKADEENCDKLVDKFLETYSPEQEEEDVEDEKDVQLNNEEYEKKTHVDIDNSSMEEQPHVDNQEKRKALKSSLSEFIKLPKSPPRTSKKGEHSDDIDKAESESKPHDVDGALSSSDCELLNESNLQPKPAKTPKKSFEIMLSEAENRNKKQKVDTSDLISLSSDSSTSSASDAETVDGEQSKSEQQSRAIKPMLRQDQLASETRRAQKSEADRIRRLEKKQNMLAKVLKERNKKCEGKPEAQNELILDYNSETKTFIKVHPDIVKQLKSHQFDGIKFMYDSCYGGVDALKKSQGSGCILAHCMGLGKTLQLIALLHTVISYKELKTSKILVLCPKSTVMNWNDEIIRWLGPLNSKNLKVFTFNDTSDVNEKLKVVRDWSQSNFKRAGCLLVGYEAFRSLVFYHSYKNRNNYGSNYMEDIRDRVENYLLKPGADLVVCDEGHIIKNSKSAISMAVSKITTPKRIVLTGTPIQNNLKEYYSMVNFIKPLFLGTEKEFANLYANPIKNGQHKDSSKRDIKVMKQRSFVLHKKLSKFVQRKEAELLKTFLPKKFEYVLFIPMTDVQINLYEHILEKLTRREESRGRGLIMDYTCLRKIWTHPKVLEDAWSNAVHQKYGKKDIVRKPPSEKIGHSDDDQPDDIYDSQTGIMSVTNDWWRHLLSERDLQTIMPSNKLRTMFEILRMCEEKDEKCLIFSAFVAVLNVVEFFFKKITQGDPETLKELNIAPSSKLRNKWVLGQDYYRLDGKTAKNLRHEMVIRFNDPANRQARVFLISAKAGGQGINLIGANRVIILDTSWNPSNDQQNIFRVFRLGQKKNCYIYRLLAMGTMEEKVYSRSVTKQAMSFRVVDEQQIDRHYSMAELAELYTLTKPKMAERPMPIFPQDSILASLLLNFPDMLFKYHEHDSLLENKVEQELSEQEKADAWAAYERDLQITSEMQEPIIDGLKNSYGMAPYFRSPYGSIGGIDMQTILNYSNLANTASSSPYIQSLLAQYSNFPAPSHPQYMEVLNMYSKYAQSSMGFPDLNTLAAGSAFANPSSSANLSGKPSMPGPASSPLSALGDLTGFYGMSGLSKNYAPTNAGSSSTNPSPSMYMQRSTATTESMLFPSTFNAKSTPSYPTAYPHTGLYNFGSDFTPPATNVMNLGFPSSSSTNIHLSNVPVPTPPSTISLTTSGLFPTPITSISNTMSTNSNNKSKSSTGTTTINNSTSRMEYSSTNPPPLVDLTKPTNQAIANASSSKKSKNDATNTVSTTNTITSTGMSRAHPVAIAVSALHKQANSPAALSPVGKQNNKNLTSKLNSEMLIIPTTSPPGPTSISKQFSDISPSISLTALNNTPTLTPINTNNQHSKNVHKQPLNSPTNLPLANGKSNTKSIITSTSKSLTNQVTTPPKIKVANFATLSRQTNNASPANNNNAATNNGTHSKFSNTKSSTTAAPTITTTTTTAQNKRSAYPPLANLSYTNQKKPNATSTTLTPAQLQRLRAFGSQAASGSGSASVRNSNEISIRPMDSKATTAAGDNVYIIETNINDKRVAIGAPTRSGNGTTVTKVTTPAKRKNVDILQMERKKPR